MGAERIQSCAASKEEGEEKRRGGEKQKEAALIAPKWFKFDLRGVKLLPPCCSAWTHDGSSGSPEDGGSPAGERRPARQSYIQR